MSLSYLRPIHPLRPLGLAVSLDLNRPRDLLADLRALPRHVRPEDRDLFETARAAADALAQSAILFEQADDPRRAVASPAFMFEARAAAAGLLKVAGMPWPDVPADVRMPPEIAYRDFADGLRRMADGRVPRPDVRNFLTNVTKALSPLGSPSVWRFDILPRWETMKT